MLHFAFVYVEPALHLGDKTNVVMVYELSVWLKIIYKNFIENCICDHEQNWSVVVFCCFLV